MIVEVEPVPDRQVEPVPERQVEPVPERQVEPVPDRQTDQAGPKPTRQMTLQESCSRDQFYSCKYLLVCLSLDFSNCNPPLLVDSAEYIDCARALTVCVAKDGFPDSIVEKEGFRHLSKTLRKRFSVPTRQTVCTIFI